MAFRMDAPQMKIAEKLIILNDRAIGMMTRLYNIKKACGDHKSKPQFLSEKSLESCIKHIVRKFPVIDTRSNAATYQQANAMKQEIIKSLSLYYYTFADLLDLRDHIMQLLTTMDASQVKLDITLNYDLTAGYMNVVVNLICIMVLLSRVDDRKAVLGLFNAAFEMANGQSEPTFPRLGQMIIDYENPLKKLAEDLGPLNRLVHSSLSSLASVYVRRNITADAWRNAQMLSLVASPQQILYAAQTDTISCEYLSLDVMDRWIILGVTVCHNTLLSDPIIASLWQRALQTGLAIRLFRDETLVVHSTVQGVFDSIKGYHKKVQEVKDHYSVALQTSLIVHRDRRRFLRGALRELCLLIKDQPGLLGPKILFVWMALSFSRDEVLWLLRHVDVWPSGGGKKNKHADEVIDKQISELLFHMHELRSLVQKYAGVIQRYYSQYISGYDALALTEIVQALEGLTEDEATIMSDFCADIARISQNSVDLRGLRLDWFRFQAYVSISRSAFCLSDNRRLAVTMNTTVFHLKMVDLLDEMLRETSDLSIYCFYTRQLENQLQQCLQLPSQSRYSIVFAHICSHFASALHDLCPEERGHVNEKSLSLCNMVLDEIAKETTSVVERLCDHEMHLQEQLSPTSCAKLIEEHVKPKTGKGATVVRAFAMPGEESVRICRDTLTLADKLQTALFELCSAVGASKQIVVAEHIFAPREYLSQQLEHQLTSSLRSLIMAGDHPRRPSELLSALHAHMAVLQNIDTAVNMDTTRLFNTVLLQQTQPLDCHSAETITSIYTKWYLEVVLRRMSAGHILFTPHLAALIPNPEYQHPFNPDQYTDTRELRALAQLLGPYGVKFMSERLIWHVACQINELYKIVNEYRDVLRIARSNFDKPEKMRELLMISSTGPMESVLQRVTIIGEILSFRGLLQVALHDVLEERLPFLLSAVHNLHESSSEHNRLVISEMCAAVGLPTEVDVALMNAVRAQTPQSQPPEEQYAVTCLLFVFIALSLPRLALSPTSTFKATLHASPNNSQCIPIAVVTLANTLFCLHGRGDVTERMKEFLALASSGLLRLSDAASDFELLKSRQSVYVLLEELVKRSPYLSFDLLESCFPYNLVRASYQHCYRSESAK
uniref:Membrane-associated protein gex-3 n=1 Tax=Ascaris lumbricoides TaxID=6252 RepID=A0A9J2PDS2_ASCLU